MVKTNIDCEFEPSFGKSVPTSPKRVKVDRPPLTVHQQKLVAENIGLVGVHLSHRVPTPQNPHRDREYDDLFQEGCLALMRAAAEFNPKGKIVFAAYAIPRIRRAVHEAIYQRFSLIRTPLRKASVRQTETGCPDPVHVPVCSLPDGLAFTAELNSPEAEGETIRHRIRRRYEKAVSLALDELRKRPWPKRNPDPIFQRLARERLLITQESLRTSLRQIARDYQLSSSRVAGYENRLSETAMTHLTRDPQMALLLEFTREDADGLNSQLDARQLVRLDRADERAFEHHFVSLSRREQAETIYDLLKQHQPDLSEIARNLHRIARTDSQPDLLLNREASDEIPSNCALAEQDSRLDG